MKALQIFCSQTITSGPVPLPQPHGGSTPVETVTRAATAADLPAELVGAFRRLPVVVTTPRARTIVATATTTVVTAIALAARTVTAK